MKVSLRPAREAVEAAPIRKLCPVYCVASTHALDSALRTCVTSLSLDSGEPSSKRKGGPSLDGRIARYPSTAAKYRLYVLSTGGLLHQTGLSCCVSGIQSASVGRLLSPD